MKVTNLKLLATSDKDLRVIAAHLQDSIILPKDIANLKKNRIFLIQLNRFMWEDVEKGVFRKNVLPEPINLSPYSLHSQTLTLGVISLRVFEVHCGRMHYVKSV